ncbi:MAG: zeta toxin family protein [Sphingobacteriales bacterium]|nr:zeta toxin family protein [Sphingobacteriales bacterium]
MPGLFIITGSNGAGKSTTGRYYLPENIRDNYEPFDGDKLFMQKRKQVYKKVTPSLKEAERIALAWLNEEFENRVTGAISNNDHFVYEGHFPEDENWSTPRRFKSAGYTIHMIFLGLSNPSVSELRVLERAKMGGHNVPPYEIQRNFYGNLIQLNNNFRLLDELQIIDTSEIIPKALAILSNGHVTDAVPVKLLHGWFEDELPSIFDLVYIFKNPKGFTKES